MGGVRCLSCHTISTVIKCLAGNSSATAYLTPEVLARPNLTIATNMYVEKILFSSSGDTPQAIGIQVATSEEALKYRIAANKEVILSAGAISSPHLLFVSGIGAAEELESAGVPVVKDLPAVGKHLLDVRTFCLQDPSQFLTCS